MTLRITHLDNGLAVVTDNMAHLESVALGIWVKAGSRDEHETENGFAHFLEHMAFKGTHSRDARAIAEAIENVGGEINASTGMETTTYYARVLKNDWRLALEILSDILVESKFDPEELERERDVILQEIASARDTPDDLVFDLAQTAAFGDHPLGRPILGTDERIGSLTRDHLIAWRDRNYHAGRMVVAAAGNIDHDALVAEASRRLGSLAGGASPERAAPAFAHQTLRADKPLDQTHVVLNFSAPSYRDPAIYRLQVLSSILGGGMSSRLFQELREKRGLCYNIFSFTTAYEDTGALGVYAATSPDHTRDMITVTSDIMQQMARTVGVDEVMRAKAQLKSALVMNLESASARADQIARQFLAFGVVPTLDEIMVHVDAVDAEAVSTLTSSLIRGKVPGIGAVGHVGTLASQEEIARQFV